MSNIFVITHLTTEIAEMGEQPLAPTIISLCVLRVSAVNHCFFKLSQVKKLNKHLNLLFLATENLLRHRTKTIVVCLCIIAILAPFITAIAISEGIRAQSLTSVEAGADLYLTFDEFGRNAAIPLKYLDEIKKIFGVTKAIPRIIGRGFLQNKLAVIVGINKENLPESISCISGRIFKSPNEVAVGCELASHF